MGVKLRLNLADVDHLTSPDRLCEKLGSTCRGTMQAKLPKAIPGFKYFPCSPNAKTPVPGFTDWQDRATDDRPQLEAWAAEYPNCNWGLACGASGLAVLDPDGPTGEQSLLDYELRTDTLPETMEQKTPRGRHLIFRDDFLLCPNSVGKLGPKLDTRGQSGYIVVEPSTIDEASYVITERPIAELPDFVSQDAGKRREAAGAAAGTGLDDDIAVGRARRLLRDYVERGDVARAGQGGDNRTYQVCAEVLNLGLSEGCALELIDTIWNCACVPPWDIDELAGKLANAALYSQNDAGAWAVLPVTEAVPPAILDRLRQEALMAAPPPPAEHTRFHWMAEDEFRSMPPPEWLLEEIFTTNSVNMLYGPSGHFKSFIAMILGGSVALSGRCAFYVAAEGISRMAAKDYPAWKLAYGVTGEVPFFMTGDMPAWSESESDYKAFSASIAAKAEAIGKPVGIIFLDTLNRALVGLEENSASEMAQFIRVADRIKQAFKCAVVLVHHTPNDGKGPRGSSALYAGCDTVLRIEANKEAKLVEMWVAKQKTSEERSAPFLYQGHKYGEGLAFTPATPKEAAILTDENDEFSAANIATILALHPSHPLSNHALLTIMKPKRPEETDEAYNQFLGKSKIGLTAAIKKNKLGQFCEGTGEGRTWRLKARS